jgi:hypothetical protein
MYYALFVFTKNKNEVQKMDEMTLLEKIRNFDFTGKVECRRKIVIKGQQHS